MELYVLRHGIAVERGARGYKNDGERPLTREGEEKMRQIAEAISGMDLQIDRILSSPLVRAQQTAQIVADALQAPVTFTESLKPDGNALHLIAEINDAKAHRVLLSGHEPSLSEFISMLTTGSSTASIELKKGGLCKLTSGKLVFGQCATLNWLLTPKLLRALRR